MKRVYAASAALICMALACVILFAGLIRADAIRILQIMAGM